MKYNRDLLRHETYDLSEEYDEKLEKIGDAISSPLRRKILRMVTKQSYSVDEISKILKIPNSTASFNIKILKEARIINVIPSPNKKGNEKDVSIGMNRITLAFFENSRKEEPLHFKSQIPIGSFIEADVCPPCSLSIPNYGPIFPMHDPAAFKHPLRVNAEAIAFLKGYITYPLPLTEVEGRIVAISILMEACSQSPFYDHHWRSDITLSLNDIEMFVFKAKGDYGDHDGFSVNPEKFATMPENVGTKYGIPLSIQINEEGTFLNGELVGEKTIDDFNLYQDKIARLKIEVKKNAQHIGGVSLFGVDIGNIGRGIKFDVAYKKI